MSFFFNKYENKNKIKFTFENWKLQWQAFFVRFRIILPTVLQIQFFNFFYQTLTLSLGFCWISNRELKNWMSGNFIHSSTSLLRKNLLKYYIPWRLLGQSKISFANFSEWCKIFLEKLFLRERKWYEAFLEKMRIFCNIPFVLDLEYFCL